MVYATAFFFVCVWCYYYSPSLIARKLINVATFQFLFHAVLLKFMHVHAVSGLDVLQKLRRAKFIVMLLLMIETNMAPVICFCWPPLATLLHRPDLFDLFIPTYFQGMSVYCSCHICIVMITVCSVELS